MAEKGKEELRECFKCNYLYSSQGWNNPIVCPDCYDDWDKSKGELTGVEGVPVLAEEDEWRCGICDGREHRLGLGTGDICSDCHAGLVYFKRSVETLTAALSYMWRKRKSNKR